MKHLKSIEVATLKKQIDLEIEKGNYEKVDSLTQTLCEIQGLDTEQEMPKSFIAKIKIKERVENLMNTKKYISKVATVLLILGISGGVAYGGTQYFRNVEHVEYGLRTGNGYIGKEDVNDSIETKRLPESNEEIKIISTEKGSDDALWSTKEIRQEISKGYKSDNGIKWEEDIANIVDVTEYSYKDYNKAIKDTDFKGLFTNPFEQDGDSIYTQYSSKVKDVNDIDDLVTNFKYNNGSFKVDESRVLDWDGAENDTVVITSSSGEVTNQRDYISENGEVFKLSDDNEMGELRTTVLVSHDEYRAIITFNDLSDKEIHEILDTISIEK